MTCGRSVVFSEYSGVSTNKTDHHDITEILLKVALKHHKHVTHKPIVDSLKELTDPSYTVQVCFIVISTSNIFICLLMGKESLDI